MLYIQGKYLFVKYLPDNYLSKTLINYYLHFSSNEIIWMIIRKLHFLIKKKCEENNWKIKKMEYISRTCSAWSVADNW